MSLPESIELNRPTSPVRPSLSNVYNHPGSFKNHGEKDGAGTLFPGSIWHANLPKFDIFNAFQAESSQQKLSNLTKLAIGTTAGLEVICTVSLCSLLIIRGILTHLRNRRQNSRALDIVLVSYVAVIVTMDFLVAVANAVYVAFTILGGETQWQVGSLICYLRDPVVKSSSVGISTNVMLAIAFEFYRRSNGSRPATTHQNNNNNSPSLASSTSLSTQQSNVSSFGNNGENIKNEIRRAMFFLGGITIFQVLLSIPAIVHIKLVPVKYFYPILAVGTNLTSTQLKFSETIVASFCLNWWDSPTLFIAYSICHFLFTFLLPLLTSFILYLIVFYRDMRSSRTRNAQSARKVRRLLATAAVIFAVCWSPYKMLTLTNDLKADPVDQQENVSLTSDSQALLILSFKLLAVLQTCINLFLYNFLITKRSSGTPSIATDTIEHTTYRTSNITTGFEHRRRASQTRNLLFFSRQISEEENDLSMIESPSNFSSSGTQL